MVAMIIIADMVVVAMVTISDCTISGYGGGGSYGYNI